MFIIHMKVWRSGYKIRKILRFGFVDSLVTNLLVVRNWVSKCHLNGKL